MKSEIFLLLFTTSLFYLDSLTRINNIYSLNKTIEPFPNTTHITLFELIDNCVTNYFIVFQTCFIYAFGSTCFVIQSCVFAYFETIDCLFKYLTICADHILSFPNSILFMFVFVLLFSIYYSPKKKLEEIEHDIVRNI